MELFQLRIGTGCAVVQVLLLSEEMPKGLSPDDLVHWDLVNREPLFTGSRINLLL